MNKPITIEQLEEEKKLLIELANLLNFHEPHNIQQQDRITHAVANVNNSIKALRSWS